MPAPKYAPPPAKAAAATVLVTKLSGALLSKDLLHEGHVMLAKNYNSGLFSFAIVRHEFICLK
jgi:hypothetical protein